MKFKNSENTVLIDTSKVPYLTFPSLSALSFIKHGFSTRLGGISKGEFASMNLGFNRGDKAETVVENYRLICESMGFSVSNLVAAEQVHNTKIKLVTEEDKGKGILRERDYEGIDGLITNTPGIPLVTYYADCVPLYFVDTKNHAIGLSHSGWRGTVKKMGQETLKAMSQYFGTASEDVVALIGPSICMDCYEVSEDVAIEFEEVFTQEQLKDILYSKGNEKYQLNLWEANRHILLEAGLKADNINLSRVCTACNSDILFSHRVTNGKRGTLAAFLMLLS